VGVLGSLGNLLPAPNFELDNRSRLSQNRGIMKTPSRTLTYVALALAVIVAAFAFRTFATAPPTPSDPQKFNLTIGRTADDYVDLKDKNAFDKALSDLTSHGGQYQLSYKATATSTPIGSYRPVTIKTDKVTTSKVAQNASAGESVANDPNVVSHLSSDLASDVKNVLATFK
jgi:hypothetical protein